MSNVNTATFCPNGATDCVNAKLAKCQDRTIQCLGALPTPSGLIKKDITSNDTLNSHSFGAKFSYTCATSGTYPNFESFIVCRVQAWVSGDVTV